MRRLQEKEEERAKKRRQEKSRPQKKQRVGFRQYIREVRQELKKGLLAAGSAHNWDHITDQIDNRSQRLARQRRPAGDRPGDRLSTCATADHGDYRVSGGAGSVGPADFIRPSDCGIPEKYRRQHLRCGRSGSRNAPLHVA